MENNIKVVELFAGVGGFRIGLEKASHAYKTVWSNQWEPSTKRQDASLIYRHVFGDEGHCNEDINTIKTTDIPDCDMLVGGFPCQDYSVASTLNKSGGIEGKKGVLWWQIYRILNEKDNLRPDYIFFENVDRLLNSPASQRGRDFAIILASLSDLGYTVEWRIINAADYGMPQRRRRTYIVGYRDNSNIQKQIAGLKEWVENDGVFANAFPFTVKDKSLSEFDIEGTIKEVSDNFNKGVKSSPFGNAGIMSNRHVYSVDAISVFDGKCMTLGDIIVDDELVPEDFFVSDEDLAKWKYEKGGKKIPRVSKDGHEYVYSEGPMAFPDALDKPSRTIITGEGGNAPSRFKHIIMTKSGRYRRLIPLELERLNMFPDNHTYLDGVTDRRRAFLMGNALVCGVVEKVGREIIIRHYNGMIIRHDTKEFHHITEEDALKISICATYYQTGSYLLGEINDNYKLQSMMTEILSAIKAHSEDLTERQKEICEWFNVCSDFDYANNHGYIAPEGEMIEIKWKY